MTMVSAVIVQMMTVSMNGSSRATKPSVTGRRVLTAEWAIAAEPSPASLEKAARWKPTMSTPIAPPATPVGSEGAGDDVGDGGRHRGDVEGDDGEAAEHVDDRHRRARAGS